MPRMSDLGQNGKNPGLFQIRFVPFWANLTHFEPKFDIPETFNTYEQRETPTKKVNSFL